MKEVAIVGSTVGGMTSGEHHGHYPNGVPAHGACTLTGTVTSGGQTKLKVGGVYAAVEGAPVSEDDCCGAGTGSLKNVPSKLKVSGKYVQTVGNATNPHNGTASILTGSPKLKIKG